jgi:antitoxin component HigA of HigAB toxin-antitoxin module
MKKYVPEIKFKTTYYISFNFTVEIDDDEGNKYDTLLALQELEYILKHENPTTILQRFEVVESDTEEYEDKPDWDMLPGGKNYD